MKPISIFKKFNQVVESCSLEEIVAQIKGEEFAEPIRRIREALLYGEEDKAQRLKKHLLAFTPSGRFEGGRKLKFLKAYHPLIVLDVDDLSGEMKIHQLINCFLPQSLSEWGTAFASPYKLWISVEDGSFLIWKIIAKQYLVKKIETMVNGQELIT